MQRKFLFLLAAVAEIARFFLLGLAAEAAGLLGAGGLAADFYRYAAAPQLLFGAAFFFLWLDGSRYAVYRPLALAGKVLSLVSGLGLFGSLLGSIRAGGILPLPAAAFASAVGILVLDLAGLILLLFYARREAAGGVEGGALVGRAVSGSREAGSSLSEPRAASGSQVASGPRGPEDIERVEV